MGFCFYLIFCFRKTSQKGTISFTVVLLLFAKMLFLQTITKENQNNTKTIPFLQL